MKPFPIPVVALGLGPGSQPEEESLDYLSMPKEMDTYCPPSLPDPEHFAVLAEARAVLHRLLELLDHAASAGEGGQIDLAGLDDDERAALNQVLAEGEASARLVDPATGLDVRIQESIFTGIWRLLTVRAGRVVDDRLEVGAVPQALRALAQEDATRPVRPWDGPLPAGVQNAPMLVAEVRDQSRRWQPGQPPHVVNLSLLPVTPEDIGFLDHQLGTGRVLILSRGYGNCRITNTLLPNTWRVVYYNSQDKVILNTVEVIDMPEVALAAPEDLCDSHTRLADIVRYLEQIR
jgi:hydrogenase-1 operon protein HyaF